MTRRMALAVQGRRLPSTQRDPAGANALRGYLFEELFVKKYDESVLDSEGAGKLARALPPWVRLAMAVQRRSDEYDVIVTWSERVSLALMTLQRFSRVAKPHVAMLYWFSRPAVQLPVRAF